MSKLIGRKVKYVEGDFIDYLYGLDDVVTVVGLGNSDADYVDVSKEGCSVQSAKVANLRYLNNKRVVA